MYMEMIGTLPGYNNYSATRARGERTNWGGANMRARRAWRSFLAARFSRFSSYRNYRWGDSSSILALTWPQKQSQSA